MKYIIKDVFVKNLPTELSPGGAAGGSAKGLPRSAEDNFVNPTFSVHTGRGCGHRGAHWDAV